MGSASAAAEMQASRPACGDGKVARAEMGGQNRPSAIESSVIKVRIERI